MTKSEGKRIHFMGIGGSGMAGTAILAKAFGYQVSGCDLQESTAYSKQLNKEKIKVFAGHDKSHIKDVDILCVTPAAFFQNRDHEEIKSAKKVITWQQFLGEYLQKNKKVVCISGTHGKSTTTAMASNVFEEANFDPWVMLGAINPAWKSSSRVGGSEYFIVESDEFFDNFLSYKPETIILNNIEYDHPDFFKTEKQMYESFAKHVKNLVGPRNLIINQDSPGIKKLLQLLDHELLDSINLIGYTIEDNPIIQLTNSTKATQIKLPEEKTEFSVSNKLMKLEDNFVLKIPGKYNISNALGVITLAALYKINMTDAKKALKSFSGIGRRLQLLGAKSKVSVYDDYAHHPTAIKATLSALKQKYPKSRIWAIVEPHTFSRTKALLPLYKDAFVNADKVIIAPIFRSRDTKDFGISGQSIVNSVDHKDIQYIDSFDQVADCVMRNKKNGDVIAVMGAGKSYELSRQLLNTLEAEKYAKKIWDYMHMNHKIKKADCILVMGSNDTRVAERGAKLFLKGYAPIIVFSGNVGRLTKDTFKKPEAEIFADVATSMGVPKEKIILESKSTNTGENVEFTKKLLSKKGIRPRRIIIVQKPYMERRAYATMKKRWPVVDVYATSPTISFVEMSKMFTSYSTYISNLVAQFGRLESYAEKRYIVKQIIPDNVIQAQEKLIEMGFNTALKDIT